MSFNSRPALIFSIIALLLAIWVFVHSSRSEPEKIPDPDLVESIAGDIIEHGGTEERKRAYILAEIATIEAYWYSMQNNGITSKKARRPIFFRTVAKLRKSGKVKDYKMKEIVYASVSATIEVRKKNITEVPDRLKQ